MLEDEQVEARCVPGLGLICPRQLEQRAQVIVAMGDTFDATPEGPVRTATLDGARGALPTIARAFSRIEFVQIAVR